MPSSPPRSLCGIVVSAGKMMKAVKVRTAKQVYNSFLRKHFLTYPSYLVADPNSSLRTGDVVRIATTWQVSKHIKHVVTEIVAPWGPPIEERPPIPSAEAREEERRSKKEAKLARKAKRQRGEQETAGLDESSGTTHVNATEGPNNLDAEEKIALGSIR
ncbi:MAG: hypothetical protein LQ351_003947 [Letrouitia transgressa]|nr:MAG: hypothetical protein LQ351_003947 [Letrouitia transgressa]